MINYIDCWLDAWASWRKDRDLKLGYDSRSTIHKMMTAHAETSKKRYRQKRHVIALGEGDEARTAVRHTEPMYAKETVTFAPQRTEDNPLCEAMELAVCDLPIQLRDVVLIKYVSQFSDPTGAALTRFSLAYYKTLVNYAHHGLDGYLRAAKPELVMKVRAGMITERAG